VGFGRSSSSSKPDGQRRLDDSCYPAESALVSRRSILNQQNRSHD
jgi:hypothetical protein